MASALITLLLSLLFVCASSSRSDEEVRQLLRKWMIDNDRSYDNPLEEEKRFQVFKDNLRYIDEHNAAAERGNYSLRLGLTLFADLTNEEFQLREPCVLLDDRESPESNNYYTLQGGDELQESVDWRAKGAVSSIKNQGSCGGCWAFTTVATVEGINKIVTDKLIDLSPQELIDCVTTNKGCGGGKVSKAYEYIIQNEGIASEKDYPYHASNGVCDDKNKAKAAFIDGYGNVQKSNELALKLAVARQPVSVAIDARSKAFQLYISGMFYASQCDTNLSHGVTIVGYDIKNGDKYWIAKNSWGTQWGESGYIKMERTDATNTPGTCGLALFPKYPTKKSVSSQPIHSVISGNSGAVCA